MGTSPSVCREKDIDFPKHLAAPDLWPSDLQVRSGELLGRRSLNPRSRNSSGVYAHENQ